MAGRVRGRRQDAALSCCPVSLPPRNPAIGGVGAGAARGRRQDRRDGDHAPALPQSHRADLGHRQIRRRRLCALARHRAGAGARSERRRGQDPGGGGTQEARHLAKLDR
jgi:hypothetical protein